ncbi:MAG: hypothetical protein WC356_00885 [Candidatus Micrarchaeia archaeon]|jgi:predicted transcriptional regulator
MKNKPNIKNIFMHIKPVKMLILLKEEEETWFLSKIARQSNSTYVYTKQIMDILKKENIIEIKEEGRIKKLNITPKGMEIANLLEELLKKCESKEIILPLE